MLKRSKVLSNAASAGFILSVILSGQVLAEQVDTSPVSDAINPGDSDSKWVLGLHMGDFNNPLVGEGTEVFIAPNLEYRGEYFFIKDGQMGVTVYRQPSYSVGLVLTGTSSGLEYKKDYEDNGRLVGLTERAGTLDAGVYFLHKSDAGRLKVSLLSEVTGEHNGQSADVNYVFDYKVKDWNINPIVGATWQSADAVDHFYGVSTAEANSNRSAYEGKSAVNLYAGLRGRYEINQHWDVITSATYVHFGKGIADSSIVEDDGVFIGSAGINYNF
jgi:MipA family protein